MWGLEHSASERAKRLKSNADTLVAYAVLRLHAKVQF